jgi:hypothetical protein
MPDRETTRLMTHKHTRLLTTLTVRVALGAALVMLVAAGTARAQAADPPPDPRAAQPERPTVATHAFTVAPGIVELETGFQQQRPVAGSNMVTVPILFKIGLAPRVQLDVAPGWLYASADGKGQAGLTDLTLGLKVRLTDDDTPVVGAFALQPSVSVATGSVDKGTGIGSPTFTILAISSHNIHGVALDLNTGYTRRGGDGTIAPQNSTMWTISTAWPLGGPVGLAAEIFGYPRTTGVAGGPGIVAFLVGPTVTVKKFFVLDVGAILDVRNYGGTAVYGGVTWNMGHAWSPASARPAK